MKKVELAQGHVASKHRGSVWVQIVCLERSARLPFNMCKYVRTVYMFSTIIVIQKIMKDKWVGEAD